MHAQHDFNMGTQLLNVLALNHLEADDAAARVKRTALEGRIIETAFRTVDISN